MYFYDNSICVCSKLCAYSFDCVQHDWHLCTCDNCMYPVITMNRSYCGSSFVVVTIYGSLLAIIFVRYSLSALCLVSTPFRQLWRRWTVL